MPQAPSTDLPSPTKPVGREAVVTALTDAAARLIIEHGTHVSVRQIAAEAGVNHGLVHAYFGTKQDLLVAAVDQITWRASGELDPAGFPPADLAERRGGDLARALARMQLDDLGGLITEHPITTSWRHALAEREPDLEPETIDEKVTVAATLALGWAVFGERLCASIGADAARRQAMNDHVSALVAEIGGLPDPPTS